MVYVHWLLWQQLILIKHEITLKSAAYVLSVAVSCLMYTPLDSYFVNGLNLTSMIFLYDAGLFAHNLVVFHKMLMLVLLFFLSGNNYQRFDLF